MVQCDIKAINTQFLCYKGWMEKPSNTISHRDSIDDMIQSSHRSHKCLLLNIPPLNKVSW